MSDRSLMPLAFAFLAVFTRLGALAMVAPALLPPATPGRVRTLGLVAISAAMVAGLPQLPRLDAPYLALLLEILLGTSMGLAVRGVTTAVGFAADLVDVHAGFSFSQLLDPMTQVQAGPVSRLLQTFAALLFVISDAHRWVIRALARSLTALPPGGLAFRAEAALAASHQIGGAYADGLRLAAPLLGVLLALQLCLAFISRVAPQLNVWGIGLGLTSVVVLLCIHLYLPALATEVVSLTRAGVGQMGQAWMGRRG